MTLITHFRTKTHIVVASDSMETRPIGRYFNEGMESWVFSKEDKLIVNKEGEIVALYGRNIISDEELHLLSREDIRARLLAIQVERDDSSTGILFVCIERSYLIYRFPGVDKFVIIYEVLMKNSFFDFPNEESVSNNKEVEEKLQILINQPVFFNEQFYKNVIAGRRKFLYSHQKLLSESFIKTFESIWPEFDLDIESTEQQIIDLIISFYDKVYSDWKQHRDCIGGDIQISITNQNGEIRKYSFSRDLPLVEAIWPKNSTPESRRGKDELGINILEDHEDLIELEIEDSYVRENPDGEF